MQNESVLVLDIYPQTLAIVRSLSRADYRVILGRSSQHRKSSVEYSRHCDEVWIHPEYGPTFEGRLTAFLDSRADIRYLFPAGEPGMRMVAECRTLPQRPITIVMVSSELLAACQDKVRANALARVAGLRVPESRVVENVEALTRAATEIGLPVIVKASDSEHKVHGRKAYVVSTQA